jgi:hypothetical protein
LNRYGGLTTFLAVLVADEERRGGWVMRLRILSDFPMYSLRERVLDRARRGTIGIQPDAPQELPLRRPDDGHLYWNLSVERPCS